MDLTPNDIRNFEFPTQIRGYDKETVEKFAEQVAEAIETLKQENVKLSMQLESTKGELDGIKQFEDAIKSAAIDARCNADLTMANAKKEADKILVDAREAAEQSIRSSQQKLESIQKQLKAIGATRASYIEQTQQMMKSHLAMIEEIEKGDAQALSSEEQICVTDSAEVDESQKETIAQPAKSLNNTADLAENNELKQALSEPAPQEIDPELAEALQNYKQEATKDQPIPNQAVAPKQGEMVETTARAEDIPEGFINNSDETAGDEKNIKLKPSPAKTGDIDLASELDNVVAKFEEEMDKADKS